MKASKGRRVLRVAHVIHELGPGGAEKLLVDLADLFPEVGVEMSVVGLMPTPDIGYADDLERRGVKVRSLDLASRWDLRGRRRAVKVLRDLEPDVVHTHLKHADILGGRAAGAVGAAHVSTLHVIEDDVGLLGRMKRDAGMRARRRTATTTIAVSSAVRGWYLDTYPSLDPKSVVVVRNGILTPAPTTLDDRSQVRADLGVADHQTLAVTVAILRPGKGLEDLLRAAGAVGEDIVFGIVGSGPEEARLKAMALSLGVADRVRFTGFRSDVDRLLAGADLLVHPSHTDALPTAVIQASAAAVPVVGTAVGGIPEIVTPDTGTLVAPRAPAMLASAIDQLAADPDRRRWLGKQARERFDAHFDGRVWAARLRELYDALVA